MAEDCAADAMQTLIRILSSLIIVNIAAHTCSIVPISTTRGEVALWHLALINQYLSERITLINEISEYRN